jgi:hypothetical protein
LTTTSRCRRSRSRNRAGLLVRIRPIKSRRQKRGRTWFIRFAPSWALVTVVTLIASTTTFAGACKPRPASCPISTGQITAIGIGVPGSAPSWDCPQLFFLSAANSCCHCEFWLSQLRPVVRQNCDRHSNQSVGRSAGLRVCPYDTDIMLCLLRSLAVLFIRVFRSRRDLLLENLALRQQLVGLKQRHARPQVSISDKLFWVILRRVWPEWEARVDPRPARDCCSLAQCRVQAVLDVALAPSGSGGQKMRQQGIARADLSHGSGKLHMGRTAHPRRTENAWLRSFRANRVALDAESAEESCAGQAMGGLSEQSSGSHRRNGFFYCANADLRSALLVFRHRA